MKGVILGICPHAQLIDITHDIPPYAIAEGAYTLGQAWRCFPKGTTHLAVVDPGVGGERRPILAEADGHRFVAPDNGLVGFILRSFPRATVRHLSNVDFFRKAVSRTFHGRDIFAPVSGHLARGIAPKRFGDVISDTVFGDFSAPSLDSSGSWVASVLKVDHFGNVISNLETTAFSQIAHEPFRIRAGRNTVTAFRHTYSGARRQEVFAIFGSSGFVELSMNQSDAASRLGLRCGSQLTLRLESGPGTRTRRASR
jgi:S-adenosylmethionine hydrolase